VSSRKNFSKPSDYLAAPSLLRISEVARRLEISSSALRSWETLGLISPKRTKSRYRMYTESDVRLLQRAIFLRRARGLNPPAIVHVLRKQGLVNGPVDAPQLPGQRFRRLRVRRGLSLAQVARATGVSVGFLSALERGQMRCSVATLRRLARFFLGEDDFTAGSSDAIASEDRFGLVFVNLHRGSVFRSTLKQSASVRILTSSET
jgi:DNA-binding transcriptional MerR regulator